MRCPPQLTSCAVAVLGQDHFPRPPRAGAALLRVPGLCVPPPQGHRRVPAGRCPRWRVSSPGRAAAAGWLQSPKAPVHIEWIHARLSVASLVCGFRSGAANKRLHASAVGLLGPHARSHFRAAPACPRLPSTADQRRYWAGNPAEWQFVSADEIAHEFYNNTGPRCCRCCRRGCCSCCHRHAAAVAESRLCKYCRGQLCRPCCCRLCCPCAPRQH